MKSFIQNLSTPAEFCLVMLVAFGVAICQTVWMFANPQPIVIDNASILSIVLVEILQLTIVLWIGRHRGWSMATFGTRIAWRETGVGLLLYVVMILAQGAVVALAYAIPLEVPDFKIAGLTLPVIILVSIVNPVYEETLEAGYFIHTLQRFGMWPVVLASGALRGLLHMGLGPAGALNALVLGVISGLVYWRWRQLWPLIVAHSLINLLGFLAMMRDAQ